MRAVLRAARGVLVGARQATSMVRVLAGRRAAWHKGLVTRRHEHYGIERGNAPARAMLGVALRCADFVTARCPLTRRLSQAGRSLPCGYQCRCSCNVTDPRNCNATLDLPTAAEEAGGHVPDRPCRLRPRPAEIRKTPSSRRPALKWDGGRVAFWRGRCSRTARAGRAVDGTSGEIWQCGVDD